VSMSVSTAAPLGSKRPCLRAIAGPDTRNHNPRVGGSRPSSGIAVCRGFWSMLADQQVFWGAACPPPVPNESLRTATDR